MLDLITVGAGLSGIALAQAASARGADLLVLEARTRLGGRVLGHRTAAGVYDLGPAWIWPDMQPRVAQLARAAGVALVEQSATGQFVFQDERGVTQRLPYGFAQQPPSMRVVGGITALVAHLAAGLAPQTLRLEHVVERITLLESGVEVAARSPSGVVTLRAARVALALPPRLVADIDFSPALPSAVRRVLAAVPGWMAGQGKALALYDRPHWSEAGLSGGAFSRAGPLGEVHDASLVYADEHALFGFFAWSAEQRRARRTDLPDLVAHQLGAMFGAPAAQPRELVIQDWACEPFTATAADAGNGAGHPEYRPISLPDPWRHRVLLAGAEVAPEFGGYLEGTLAAAESALAAVEALDREVGHGL